MITNSKPVTLPRKHDKPWKKYQLEGMEAKASKVYGEELTRAKPMEQLVIPLTCSTSETNDKFRPVLQQEITSPQWQPTTTPLKMTIINLTQ